MNEDFYKEVLVMLKNQGWLWNNLHNRRFLRFLISSAIVALMMETNKERTEQHADIQV